MQPFFQKNRLREEFQNFSTNQAINISPTINLHDGLILPDSI